MELNTRQDFEALMHKILNPLIPRYSAHGARLPLGHTGATYGPEAIELEAFSRPLWALVPFWVGGGKDDTFADIYRRGLAAGTNPRDEEYWGGFTDYDQRFVEMAAIACGMILAPDKIWNPLTQAEKENLAKWLDGINHYVIPECNWQFFMILVNVALKKCGMPYNAQRMEEGLEKIESYYKGEGWYQDGAPPQKDYYISFAIHYYGLVYAKVMEQEDARRSVLFKERATVFAKQFVYWFSEDGSALPFGRSLTYRYAQAAFWSACLFAGIEPFSVAEIKGILVRHFDYWLKQEIFDTDGILTIGYAYPNLFMSEHYNAPGSPYWSMKTFLMLALPDSHAFWHVEPAPLPKLQALQTLRYADMVVQRREGDVTAYVPGANELYGHGNTPQKYAKFAYSTAFGFSISRSNFVLHEASPDSMLAFEIDDYIFVRKRSESFVIESDSVVSVWVPFPGITVKTTVTPTATGHTRKHEITSEIPCTAYDCGFSVERFRKGECQQSITAAAAQVKNNVSSCTVTALQTSTKAEGGILTADPNTNLIMQNAYIPYIKYCIEKGQNTLYTSVDTKLF
ncbi:MAG: DUF2264 domain-containing protein [Oscillospiraceae bacterium]|nr:DUF2264 domain-containing protein [Oscillospiraceae bacterium]